MVTVPNDAREDYEKLVASKGEAIADFVWRFCKERNEYMQDAEVDFEQAMRRLLAPLSEHLARKEQTVLAQRPNGKTTLVHLRLSSDDDSAYEKILDELLTS